MAADSPPLVFEPLARDVPIGGAVCYAAGGYGHAGVRGRYVGLDGNGRILVAVPAHGGERVVAAWPHELFPVGWCDGPMGGLIDE